MRGVSRAIASLVFINLLASCVTASGGDASDFDYRQAMRDFVIGIAARARTVDPDFIVIPQNGNELITLDGESDGSLAQSYVTVIDGVGREDLLYGYENDDEATPADETEYMLGFLDRAETTGIEVLVTDYCTTEESVDDTYTRNGARGYISFAAERDLAGIPTYPAQPPGVHNGNVTDLSDANNFLYILDPWGFGSREAYLDALRGSKHDLLIVDLYAPDSSGDGVMPLSASELNSLGAKNGGGTRLVVAYMSIGEAEDYRPYWNPSWERDPPEWLERENRDWPGNYKVRYWLESWQEIILGPGGASITSVPPDPGSYLGLILTAGFDGVYLDIIDAFEYFE